MPTQNPRQWVTWIFKNNIPYSKDLSTGIIQRMTMPEAVTYCQNYINAMIKKDGKRNILYQEKQMIQQLGLEA